MIDNVKVPQVDYEKLELSLYRSYGHSDNAQKCSEKFISTVAKALDADDVSLMCKSDNGNWKIIDSVDSKYTGLALAIPSNVLTALQKQHLFLDDGTHILYQINKKKKSVSQLYVPITIDSLLHVSFKRRISVEMEYEWILNPCRSFYNYYVFLDNQEIIRAGHNDLIVKEAAPKESLLLIPSIQDESPIGQLSLDKDYNIVSFNKAAADFAVSEYKRKIKTCKNFSDLLGSDRFASLRSRILDRVENGESVEFEDTVDLEDEVMYTKKSCSPVHDSHKAFVGYMIFINNITNLKNNEALASRNNQVYKSILDISVDSHLSFDKNMKVIFFNEKARLLHKDFLGINLEKGMHINSIASNPSSFWNKSTLKIELPPADGHKKEIVNYTINGQNIFLKVVITPILNANNEVIGFTESSTDITESVLKSRNIGQQLSTLNAVLNSTFNSIYAIDPDFKLIAINQKAQDDFERFCGIRPVVGQYLSDIIEPNILKRWNSEYYKKVLKGEKISYVGKNSSDMSVESMYSPVVDQDNVIIGCLEVCRDISELIQSKNELELSEAQLRVLVENVPSGIIRSNLRGEILDVSKSAINITGYSTKELTDTNLYDLLHDSDKKSMKIYLEELSDNNTITSLRLIHKDGSTVFVEGIGSLINNDSVADPEFLLTFNNVTDRMTIERNLEVAKGNYNALFKNMNDSILVYNFDTWELLDHNEAFLRFYGLDRIDNISKEDMLPKKSDYLPDVNLWLEFNKALIKIKNRETLKVTSVLYDSDKNEKLVEISIFPSLEEETIAYLVVKDISLQYSITMENKRKTAIYEKLISESAEGIDIVEYKLPTASPILEDMEPFLESDDRNKVIVRNELMYKYLNGSTRTVTSINEIVDVLTPIQRNGMTGLETAKKIVQDLLENNRTSCEIQLKVGNEVFDLYLIQNVVPVKGKLYIIRHILDITEKKKSEKIIEKQILDLNESNKDLQMYIDSNLQLENFAYIASHDLKAPIRSVISFMQLLRKNIANQVDEKNLKFIDIVLAASTNMQVLIDDLLDYSRINTQAVVFEHVDLNKMLRGLQRDIITTIEESNTELIIADMPTVVADNSRIRQVFQNLITNAIKFVDKGDKPKVDISYREISDGHQFTVRDNGIGIEEEYLDKIFLMFKKLHSENRYTGTGIGLSICKKVIDQHNGKIWVESELNKGSTFHFTISKGLSVD